MDDKHIPITAESAKEMAKQARKEGYEEVAEIFESLADKFARFNEQSPLTIEEVRQRLGDERFFRLLKGE